MSLNQSMNISLGSMKNNQYALTVVSQNIANVHVEGYHRQRVNFVTNEYTTKCENVLSTIRGMNGASISSLTDFIDDATFKNALNSNSEANYYNTLADALGDLEGITDDLGDNGLNGLLNEFFAAAVSLEQFPSDITVRQNYVLAAQNVCDKFNDISKKYDNIQDNKFDSIGTDVNMINSLLADLAEYNKMHVENGQSTQTQAEINNILQTLSNYMNITTTTNQNGSINVFIGDTAVVRGADVKYTLEAKFDANSDTNAVDLSLKSTENGSYIVRDISDSFKSGSMKANLQFLNGSNPSFANINDMKKAIDSAASAFAQELNTIQTYSSPDGNIFAASLKTDANGNLILEKATEDMFTSIDGQPFSASNIQVNTKIMENPYLVAAARIDLADYKDEATGVIDGNWIYAIGNSDNAVEITALQNKKICSTSPDGTKNCTLSQFLTNTAAKNGVDIANIQTKADTANDIADMDATNYANLIGVNLDEELADMIKYQRSYEASAKLFSTINDLMGTIINMV